MADGRVIIDTAVDNSGLKTGLKSTKGILSDVKSSLAGIGKAAIAAFAIGGIVAFGKQCIELGSNVAEVQNVVDVAFGDMTHKIEAFAKDSVQSFGMSQLSAKKTASTYMAMAKGMGMEEQAASDMAISLTGLTGDVASFFNITQELADTKLKSVFTGETETLKDLGVVMTQANLNAYAMANGFGKTVNKMTQAEAVQLRYAYVTEQLRLASGDFIRTQDSWANQTRILSEQWKQLMSIMGKGMIQVLTPMLRVLNQIVSYLITVADAASQAMSALFGAPVQKASATAAVAADIAAAAENQKELTDATKETAKAAKDATLGFDELNVISQDTADGASGSAMGVAAVPGYDPSATQASGESGAAGVSNWLSKIDLKPTVDSFRNFVGSVKELLALNWDSVKWIWNEVLKPLGSFVISEVVPRFFDTLSVSLEHFNTIFEKVKPILEEFFEGFLKPIASFVGGRLMESWDKVNAKLKEFTQWLQETELFDDLRTVLTAIYTVLKPVVTLVIGLLAWISDFVISQSFIDLKWRFEDIADVLGLIAAIINLDFKDAWEHLMDLLVDNRVGEAKEKFGDLLTSLKDGIVDWFEEDIKPWFTKEKWGELLENIGISIGEAVKDLRDTWTERIVPWWDEDIKPWFTKEKWLELFENISNSISEWWEEDIKPWFTKEKWEEFGTDMKEGLINGFKGIRNGIAGIINKVLSAFEGLANGFAGGINKIIEGFNSVPGLGDLPYFKTLDLSRWKIPMLAQGAVIPPNREFLAVLGDQKNGTNIETPLDTMIAAFKTALAEGGYNGGDTVVNLTAELDGEVIYRNQERVRQKRGTQTVLNGAFAR